MDVACRFLILIGGGLIAGLPLMAQRATPQDRVPDVSQYANGDLPLVATGATVIDALTGEPLYEREPDRVLYPASATKIMTALLVIEAGHLDKMVVIQPEDTKVEPSALEFKPGESYTRRSLLYGLMLKSANDASIALARDNAGSVAAFAEKMTERAWGLGARSTQFKNPHGLHDRQHFTTAHDLALIAKAAMEQPVFRSLVGTQRHEWVTNNGVELLKNHNRLLGRFPGCTGVKTGYTVAAQQVLVSAAQWGTREVIAVVLHTNKPGIWEDSKLLLTYGFARLENEDLAILRRDAGDSAEKRTAGARISEE